MQIYKSSDYGTQPLTQQKGSFNAVLKSVLVDGYGAKAAAGWTLEYEDQAEDICVFRNQTQTAFLWSAFDQEGWQLIKACESVIDGECVNPTLPVFIRYDVSGNIPYALIADERCFYLKIDAGYDRNINQVYFFGDFISLISGDLYNFAITGVKKSSEEQVITPVCGYDSGLLYFLKDRNGTGPCGGFSATKNNIGTDSWFGNLESPVSYPYNGAVFREKPFFCESGGYPRGKLPGLTVFGHNGIDLMSTANIAYRSGIIDDTIKNCVVEGHEYIAMHTQKGIIFLDTQNWWTL